MNRAEKFVNKVYAATPGNHLRKMGEVYVSLYRKFRKATTWMELPLKYRKAANTLHQEKKPF